MATILGFISSILGVFRSRQLSTPSDQQLEDIGAIMDGDYYKRDIVIAAKKISTSPYPEERLQAMRDVGHFAWLGGPAAAKFAATNLIEFTALLDNDATPIELKKQTLFTITEICSCVRENQDKARGIGILSMLHDLLDAPEATIRRGATACLVTLINENYENHKTLANMQGIKEKLLKILQDDWRTWKRNEAARLILMLWLNRVNQVKSDHEGNCTELTKA